MRSDEMSKWVAARADAGIGILLALGAFILCLTTGRKGFFPFDQSIVFDGGYRIVTGQVPFKDFVAPVGPVVFWLQAGLFKLLGVNYLTYVLGAAMMNVLATLISMLILRRLFPQRPGLAYVAGLLTAIWFYPPFGTPYMEQTAALFGMLALGLILASVDQLAKAPLKGSLLALGAGAAALTAIITKQNVGLPLLPLYLLIIVVAAWAGVGSLRRGALAFLAGLGAALAAFLGWLFLESNPAKFYEFAIRLPASVGAVRAAGRWDVVLQRLATSRLLVVLSLFAFLCFLAYGVMAANLLRQRTRLPAQVAFRLAAQGLVCLYLILFTYVFIVTTNNDMDNACGFTGIILAVGGGLCWEYWETVGKDAARRWPTFARQSLPKALAVSVALVIVFWAYRGLHVSLNRSVHDAIQGATAFEPVTYSGLEDLQWARPTRITPRVAGSPEISRADVVALATYLAGTHGNFFVFPDFTMLYGVLRVPSPQPILWFHKGLTYPETYDPVLDRWIVQTLERHDVRFVVLEQESFLGTANRLDDFPQLKAWLGAAFVPVQHIGTFVIYKRQGDL